MKWLACLCALLSSSCGSLDRYLESNLASARDALNHGELPQSRKYANRGLELATYLRDERSLWNFRAVSAEIHLAQRDPGPALSILRHDVPPDLERSETAVRVFMARGYASSLLGKFEDADRSFEKASRLLELPENRHLSAEFLTLRGVDEYFRGHIEGSQRQLNEAIAFARVNHQPFVEAVAMSRLGGVLTVTENFGPAIEWLIPATALTRQLAIRTTLETNAASLGWSYYKIGDFDRALPLLREAEGLAGELGLLAKQSRYLNDIGLIFLERDDFHSASVYFLRGLSVARQSRDNVEIIRSLHNLSISSFDSKDYTASKRYHAEEVQLTKPGSGDPYARYVEGFIQSSEGHNEAAEAQFRAVIKEARNEPSLQWQAQIWLARIHIDEHRTELVDQDYADAIHSLEAARFKLGNDEFKLQFRAAANQYYNAYIRFLMQNGKPEAALRVVELSRAQVLADSLGVPATAASGLPRLQATAAAMHATILTYWLAPRSSYLFVISPSRFAAFTLPGEPEISPLVESHFRFVASSSKDQDVRLFQTLLAPAQQFLPKGSRVIVIPDGILNRLNFETLLVPGEPAPHYWIEDAVVSSTTSLALLRQRPRGAAARNVLIFGNAAAASPEFAPLLHADSEVRSVANRFPPTRRAVFEGALARPAAYRTSNPSNYSWIHFAAHGVSNAESPLESAIILSNDGESYKLYARDIAKIPINADLVTISACYGSGAKTYAGEGLVGLAWAFLLAGSHNVVASLWEANDYYTAQMMGTMYSRLEAGDEPAYALRAAKLELLHSEYVCRNPRYWGSFQLYNGY